jgi:hypothetical protein
MRRINIIDLIIVVILLLSAYSFITHDQPVQEQVDEYTYTGSQIYKATRYMDYLDSKGFLYDTYVEGYWWADYLKFEETGYVVDTAEGSFSMLLPDGQVVTVGGRMSYKEQVGANEVRLIIRTKSTVNYRMYAATHDSFDAWETTVRETASFLDEFAVDDIALTGSITFDAAIEPSAVFESQLEHELRSELYYVKDISVDTSDTGMTLSFTQASIEELAKLESLLSGRNITMGQVFSSDLNVFVRTAAEIGELDKYWIKEHVRDNLSDVVDGDENAIHIRL